MDYRTCFRKKGILIVAALAFLAVVCHAATSSNADDDLTTARAITVNTNGDDTASIPDFDGNGTVGFGDFVIFAGVFGASEGDEKYEARYDLNGDGEIGFTDFVIFAQNFGKDVPSPVVAIPDANLRTAVEAALGKAGGAPITQAEMATLDSLTADKRGVSDLTGLEYATNLTWLDLATNNITDITPLAGLTELRELFLQNNNISDLASLVGNTGLGKGGKVDVTNNPLNAASLSTHIPALQARGVGVSLDVPSPAVSIPDANLRAAIEATLGKTSGSPITQAEMATFDSLEASDANISDMTGLEYATNLTYLSLYDNNITDISALASLTNLTRLWLSYNKIEDISALSGLTNLTVLILESNHISDLAPLAANTGLGRGGTVDVKNNPLNAASHSTHIPALQARGVSVSYVPSPVVAIPDANLRAAIAAALGKASGAPITVAEMKRLTWRLYAVEAGIGNLTGLEFATNLKELVLWGNTITDISPLSGLTKLTRLRLGLNNITDISALSGLTNLTELSVGDANIRDISPLAGLINLTDLSLLAANIQDEDVSLLSGLTNLTSLGLSHNRIADISPLAELTGLTRLWLWDNPIEDILALSGLTNLTFLSLGKNNVSDISALSGLTRLRELFLNDNTIEDISPLAGLTNLTFLNLALNNIEDISALSGLTSLMELNLAGNRITDISALSGLTNLRNLDLRGNPYETLPKGDFDIELVFLDDFTESQKNVLQYVARRWMAVITEDLPDYDFTEGWSGTCGGQSFEIPSGKRIDDLRIYVGKERLSVGTLGFGGPIVVREATHLSVLGCMGIDLSHGNLLITGLHEIGHVLGVGSLWTELGYFQNPPDGDQYFNGPLAIAAFDAAGGRDYAGAKVPVEGGHWKGDVFGDELMTPTGTGALSAITVQSMADLGYGVDVSQADPYALPGANAGKAVAKIAADTQTNTKRWIPWDHPAISGDGGRMGRLESAERVWGGGINFDLTDNRQIWGATPPRHAEPTLTCGAGLMQEPIYVVDGQGRVVRTIRQ